MPPRNIYRGTGRMYAHDGLGLAWAYRSIDAGHGAELSLLERMFLHVPMLHVEDLAILRRAERGFEALLRDSATRSPLNQGFFESALDSARRHRDVVERFGRFPHRNEILGRTTTPEEQVALRDEKISF